MAAKKKTSAELHIDLHTLNYNIHYIHDYVNTKPNIEVQHGSSKIKKN